MKPIYKNINKNYYKFILSLIIGGWVTTVSKPYNGHILEILASSSSFKGKKLLGTYIRGIYPEWY